MADDSKPLDDIDEYTRIPPVDSARTFALAPIARVRIEAANARTPANTVSPVKTAANARCGAVGRSRRWSQRAEGGDEATGHRVADGGRVGDGPPLDVLSSEGMPDRLSALDWV